MSNGIIERPILLEEQFYPFVDTSKMWMTGLEEGPTVCGTDRFLWLPWGDDNKLLKITFSLQVYPDDGLSIIPFHLQESYKITNEDFDLGLRRAKLTRCLRKDMLPNPAASLVLLIAIGIDDLLKSEIPLIFGPDQEAYLVDRDRDLGLLRCRVTAAGSTFEAPGAMEIDSQKGFTFDGCFYPLDLGPLAAERIGETSATLGETFYDYKEEEVVMGLGHNLLFSLEEMSKIGLSFHMPRRFI